MRQFSQGRGVASEVRVRQVGISSILPRAGKVYCAAFRTVGGLCCYKGEQYYVSPVTLSSELFYWQNLGHNFAHTCTQYMRTDN